ncbi:MAG: translocation/assembly module TamB domain-containing protein [Desulfarculus sp.]|nr:translocation/assembly module TamB domain-containing protein [Desulfarculus sp.]
MAWAWGRIVAWGLSVLALTACAALAALWVLADSDWGRGQLRHHLENEVLEKTGFTLQLEGMAGNLFRGLTLEGLSLSREGRTPLRVARVELSYNPLALLLGGRLSLGRLRLDQPRLELPLVLPSGGGSAPVLSLTISHLEVTGGTLLAGGQLGPLRQVSNLDLGGHFSLDSRGPALTTHISQAELVLDGLPQPLGLAGQASYSHQRLKLPGLRLSLGPNQMEVKGGLDWRRQAQLDLEATGQISDLTQLGAPAWVPGRPASPLELSLKAHGPLATCRLEASLSRQGQSLRLEGQAGLERPALDLQGQLKGVDLVAWGLATQPALLEGTLSFSGQGLPGQPQASARLGLDLANPLGPQLGLRRVVLEADLKGGQVTVEGLKLSGEAGSLEASGQVLLPLGRRALSLQAEARFSDLTPPAALAGHLPEPWRQARLQGGLKARGNLDDLALELDLGPSRLAPGLEIARLTAKGVRAPERWVISSLEVLAGWGRLQGKGAASAEKGELEFSLEVADLAPLAPLWPSLGWQEAAPQRGALSVKGRLAGPWSAPSLSLSGQAGELVLAQALARQVELDLETPRLGLPLQGRLRLGVQELAGGGITWNKVSLEATALAEGTRLALMAQGPQLTLSLKAAGTGAAQLPLRLTLSELRLTPQGHKPWTLRDPAQLLLASDGLGLKGLMLTQAEQTLALEGQASLAGGVNASLRLGRVRLDPWLPPRVLPPEASLDLEASLSGALAAPRLELSGRLAGLVWPRLPASEVRFQGGYEDGELSLTGQALTQGRASLDLEASLGLKVSLHPPLLSPTGQGLKASASAQDLPLALLEPLIPGVGGLEGRVNLELEASGPLAAPLVTGELELKGGAFVVPNTGQAFQDLNIHLTARGREITVHNLSAVSGGPAKVRGKIWLPIGDPGQVDLTFQAQGLLIGMGGIGKVITDAEFRITGTALSPLAIGWTRPSRANIHPALATPLALGEVVVLKPGQQPPPLERQRASRAPRIVLGGLLESLTLEGRVDCGSGVRVDLDQGFMMLSGAALVRKQPGGPLVFYDSFGVGGGAMNIVGRRFVITGGRTLFAGKDVPDPDLDVDVNLGMGSTQVYIKLQGSAFSPKLVLSSEPPMNQTDILSTIIFGRPAASLNAGETRQLSAQALALLGLRGRERLESVLGPTLSPDVVTVFTEAQSGSSLEAGKYLSQDLYLRYRQNLGPDGGQNVGLEYRLNRYLSVESQIGTTRDSGVDAVFTWDFK